MSVSALLTAIKLHRLITTDKFPAENAQTTRIDP